MYVNINNKIVKKYLNMFVNNASVLLCSRIQFRTVAVLIIRPRVKGDDDLLLVKAAELSHSLSFMYVPRTCY